MNVARVYCRPEVWSASWSGSIGYVYVPMRYVSMMVETIRSNHEPETFSSFQSHCNTSEWKVSTYRWEHMQIFITWTEWRAWKCCPLGAGFSHLFSQDRNCSLSIASSASSWEIKESNVQGICCPLKWIKTTVSSSRMFVDECEQNENCDDFVCQPDSKRRYRLGLRLSVDHFGNSRCWTVAAIDRMHKPNQQMPYI